MARRPVHEDVAGERLGAEGALLEEVVDLDDVRLVDVEHGRRLHGTAPLHVRRPASLGDEEGAPPREARPGTGIPRSSGLVAGLPRWPRRVEIVHPRWPRLFLAPGRAKRRRGCMFAVAGSRRYE